jgi:hypothetical protein
MDSNCKPSNKGTLHIDFNSLVGNLQANLQHLSDLVLFSNTAISSAHENDYNNSSVFFHFQPAQNQKYSFNQAKERFGQWCLANSFKDAVDSLHCFLDECYTVCEILKSGKNSLIQLGLFHWILNIGKWRFHRLGLPDKIERLKEVYGVFSSMEAQILSLNRTRNCLVHRLGIVGTLDVDSNNVLTAKFREMQLLAISPNKDQEIIITGPTNVDGGWHVAVKNTDFSKVFKLNERIVFTEREHIWAIFTFFLFGQEMKNSICKNFNLVPPEAQQPALDVKFAGIEVGNKTGEQETIEKVSNVKSDPIS